MENCGDFTYYIRTEHGLSTDHLPSSFCPRSYWMTIWGLGLNDEQFLRHCILEYICKSLLSAFPFKKIYFQGFLLIFSNCRPKQKLQPLQWSLQLQHQLLPLSIQKVWHLYREEWQSKQRKWKTQKISKSFILELFKKCCKRFRDYIFKICVGIDCFCFVLFLHFW